MAEYLTEHTLIDFLIPLSSGNYQVNKKLRDIPELNSRPDFVDLDRKLIVEFDGYLHYTKAKTCVDDKRKDKIASNYGYKTIRIPYFVQLSREIIKHYFGRDCEYEQTYPHGFIADNVILRADFCSLGVKRFQYELINLPQQVWLDITDSLKNKSRFLGDVIVYPS